MTVIYRYPRRPAWLYPPETIIRTRFGTFRVALWSDPNSGFSMREWRGMQTNCERCEEEQ